MSAPKTPYDALIEAAGAIVLEESIKRRDRWSRRSYVHRDLLDKLEEALRATGVDLDAAIASYREIVAKTEAERR